MAADIRPGLAGGGGEARVQLLRRVGAALYGSRWQAALAGDLGVNDRTMRRWVSGEWPVPDRAWAELGQLVIRRRDTLLAVAAELEAMVLAEE